ncbi:hypothetical protein EDD99_8064 [Streptomyces sp. 846.5]|nr:hypothetical protein EDD99_8064 [Streptomyces sp. 846.5]
MHRSGVAPDRQATTASGLMAPHELIDMGDAAVIRTERFG